MKHATSWGGCPHGWWLFAGCLWFLTPVFLSERTATAACLPVPGDVAGSIEANVVDVQCQILGTLWSLGGSQSPFPSCYKVDPDQADLDCDGSISIVDAVNTILLALSGQLDTKVDANGNQCVDTCEPSLCTPGECDDGVACTVDHCLPDVGCVFAPIDSSCDDGVGCTTDLCSTDVGCIHIPNNGACPSYNPCSQGVCLADAGCIYTPSAEPSCLPPGVTCQWSAQKGEVKECTLHLTKRTANTPSPVAASFDITYDAEKLRPIGVTVQACTNGVCSQQIAPPQTIQPGGQHLTFSPSEVSSWTGHGTVALWAFAADPQPLSIAVMDTSGNILGDSELLTLYFKVQEHVPITSPTQVVVNQISAATASAQPLTGTVQYGSIVVEAKNCAAFPGSCNDNNVCTTDVCDLSTHQCQFTMMSCEDGNACMSESCDPVVGCLWEPVVCDDGIPCTLDSCDPQSGCVFVPNHTNCVDGDDLVCTESLCDGNLGCIVTANHSLCQDGDECNGEEICHGGVGCVPGLPPNCNDGVACTLDDCDPHNGCLHVSSATLCPHDGSPCTEPVCDSNKGCYLAAKIDGACFQDGVVCWVSGMMGDWVDCTIKMARHTKSTPDVVGIQLDLVYDAQMLQPTSAWTESGPMPPATVQPGGQFLTTGPADWADWQGQGTVALAAFAADAASLTPAWLDGGKLVGDAEVLRVRFKLLADAPPSFPVAVVANQITGTTSDPAPMVGTTHHGIVLLSAPTCVGNASVCDDGIECTLDQCNESTGKCVYVPLFGLCEGDGVACTVEQCIPNQGCVSAPIDDLCQDGDVCNGKEVCKPSGCAAGVAPACHDDFLCTLDGCDPLWGCTHIPANDLCPPTTAACTESICSTESGCAIAPQNTGECLPDGVVCAVSGVAGQWVDCPIRIARDTENSPPPVAVQFRTSWDPYWVMATEWGFYDCGADTKCSFVPAPPNSLPNGAVVVTGPEDDDGEMMGQLVAAAQFGSPGQPLTDAYLSGGEVQGNSELIVLRLRLSQTVTPTDPLWIKTTDAMGATAFAVPMPGEVKQGLVVLIPAQCDQNPGQCADNNPCTVDQCNTKTKQCTHEPVVCDDGDYCTDDTCDPAQGCVSSPVNCDEDAVDCTETVCTPGVGCQHVADPTQCETDGNLCTTEVCDLLGGCQSIPVWCDDLDPCTGIEGCHADFGCTAGVPKDCSDGDLCTDDTCVPYLSCAHLEVSCDDGMACTLDSCNSSTGCSHTPQDTMCADLSACTDDVCVPAQGCVHIPYPCGDKCEAQAGLCGDNLCDPGDCMADCGNLTIPAGVDLYQLGNEPVVLDFGKLPLDVFVPGVGVGQWDGQMDVVPMPLTTDPKEVLGKTSLILTRHQPFSLHLTDCGQIVQVPVAVEALGLITTEPVLVQIENQTLSYTVMSSTVQGSSSGQMTVRYLCAEGGDFELNLSVQLRLGFKSTENEKWDFEVVLPNIEWKVTGGTWVHTPEWPVKWLPPGVLVDRNHDGKIETDPLLGQSQFVAMMGPGPCNCGETSDCTNECTITELTTEEQSVLPMSWTLGGIFGVTDKNGNQIADECEP